MTGNNVIQDERLEAQIQNYTGIIENAFEDALDNQSIDDLQSELDRAFLGLNRLAGELIARINE